MRLEQLVELSASYLAAGASPRMLRFANLCKAQAFSNVGAEWCLPKWFSIGSSREVSAKWFSTCLGIYFLKRCKYAISAVLGDPFSSVVRSFSDGEGEGNREFPRQILFHDGG